MLSIICPGQGSQKSGMLEPWLKVNSNFDFVKEISKKFDFDFIYYGCDASQQEILKTSIAQPLIFITSFLSFMSLKIEPNSLSRIIFLGHSVGEIAALVAGNYISPESGIKLVIARGKFMEKSTLENGSTGMMAVLSNDLDSIKLNLAKYNLSIANYNGKNQLVVAGYLEDLGIYQNLVEPGVKKIMLDVQGAFHTHFMKSSVYSFHDVISHIPIIFTKSNFISNFDGKLINSEKDIVSKLVNQLISPVRWDLCMKYLSDNKVTSCLELAPSGVLSNLIKRDYPVIKRFALNHENIEEANYFISEGI